MKSFEINVNVGTELVKHSMPFTGNKFKKAETDLLKWELFEEKYYKFEVFVTH